MKPFRFCSMSHYIVVYPSIFETAISTLDGFNDSNGLYDSTDYKSPKDSNGYTYDNSYNGFHGSKDFNISIDSNGFNDSDGP